MNEVSINKQAKLSEHFQLGELTKTSAKTADGNIPSHVHIENLKNLCVNWLEPLRYNYFMLYCRQLGDEPYEKSKNVKPIIINSGYRSEAVNKAIGGVKGSNHLTGCAVDIHVSGIEQAIRFGCLLLDIADTSQRDFDELLIEHSSKGTFWLHFAVRPKDNRRKVRFIQT